MNKLIYTFLSCLLLITIKAQVIEIPDQNFEQALIDDNHDTDGTLNGEISMTDAEKVIILDISSENITDLTGIAAFTNLTMLYCSNNDLKTLDLSKNTELVGLFCNSNDLTELDLSKNTKLKDFFCGTNKLKNLNLSNNTNLVKLNCGANQLTSIDISNNSNLELLSCPYNQLTTLNFPGYPELRELNCVGNKVTELDLSQNTKLESLSCSHNQLTILNIRNGNNENLEIFTALSNMLECILVDDVDYATQNFTDIDENITFSDIVNGCSSCSFPDNLSISNDNSDNSGLSNPTYQSLISILTDATILPNTTVEMKAGESITLQPGFHAQAESNFHASIETCESIQPKILIDINEEVQNILTNNRTYQATTIQDEINVQLTIQPNIVQQQALIQLDLSADMIINLELFNYNGQREMILLQNQWHQKGSNYFMLDASQLPEGFYFIQLTGEKNRLVKKLVIQRK